MFHPLNKKRPLTAIGRRGVMGCLIATILLLITHSGCKKEDTLSVPVVAYISNDDHSYGEIYLCKFQGNKPQRISKVNPSTNPAFDGEKSPEFSPDGSKIMFRGLTIAYGYLRVYDLATKQLTEMDRVTHSVWSPDGKQIAYLSYVDLSGRIKLINPDGTNQKDLTDFYYGDTAVAFEHFQWHPTENKLIATCQMTHNGIVFDNLVSIDPITGNIKEKYNLPLSKPFTLRGNKIAWMENDSVFVYDLISRNKTGFAAFGDSPANPVISPDGSRVAYTFVRKYTYLGSQYECTDIVTCNLNGFDKREITVNPTIKDETKYKRDFYPFWLSNTELLYSAGAVYKVSDDISPIVEVVAQVTKANGQVQANKK